ncbi:hypothetical protein Q4488_04090 [Amphritea sp. 1_MG-2023]|uniref:hypothetical protein n=1 Tax=Amphritea sp. 1_MG-2023 TaxID=3062670 RepID=UPI0026E46786|nr:hypothetical protein [Amphritea sp. 1_MG-2023]MDO6562558.1 hypothetical protein [Amphritea sp. 1_MG-2023]
MKSYLFTTDTDRGGVMLCDIDDFDTAVDYLCKRFDGVVKIESSEQLWQLTEENASTADDSAVNAAASVAESATDKLEVASVDSPGSADLFG